MSNPSFQAQAIQVELVPTESVHKLKLMMTLVIGLIALAALVIVAVIILELNDKSTAAVVPVITLIVGGVIGLFAPSPTGASGGSATIHPQPPTQ